VKGKKGNEKKGKAHKVTSWLYSTNMISRPHPVTRKSSCRKGYARQRVTRDSADTQRTGNGAIRYTDHENPSLEPNMEWIGCTVCEIIAFKLYCDLETGVRGHSKSSKVALFDRAHKTLYSSSIVNMPLSLTVSEI